MIIDKSQIKVTFSFSPSTHFLVYATPWGTGPKEWSLNPRINRSEKGKDDDVGVAEIFISKEDATECKKARFTFIEL